MAQWNYGMLKVVSDWLVLNLLKIFYKYILYKYKLLYLTFTNTYCYIIIFRRIHSWFSGFRKWRQWWSRLENPGQFNQTGLRRRIPKWHWRDQTFGSGFWRSWFQMMLNLDMFFADDDGKNPDLPSPLSCSFILQNIMSDKVIIFLQTNKQKKPSQYPLLKNSWWIHEKSMMKKKY